MNIQGQLASINPTDNVKQWVKYMHCIAQLSMTLNNILAQTEDNIRVQADMFFNIGFNKDK